MEKEVKRKISRSHIITVYINETNKKGKYYGDVQYLGQSKPASGAFHYISHNVYGDDPDKIIEEMKSKINKHFSN